MEIRRLLITGDRMFLRRREILIEALRDRVPELEVLETGGYYEKMPGYLAYVASRLRHGNDGSGRFMDYLLKSKSAFKNRSREMISAIQALPKRPDHILHMHAMYAPIWPVSKTPPAQKPVGSFSILTDYTAALCARNWEPWAPHRGTKACDEWIECQRVAYESATHLFTYSGVCRDSMRDDYGIDEGKVTVVGHAGDARKPFEGEKKLGSKQLLLNGSDWQRKGADIALEAFRSVRERVPGARLVVIGCPPREAEPDVDYRGKIRDRDELHRIFLDTDIVLSPARCDPLPTFGVETMTYGIPAVVSDRDGMPEMVDYGKCGSVATLDAASVAREIITLLEDPVLLRAKSDAGRAQVRAKFNWDTIADTMVEAWRRAEP